MKPENIVGESKSLPCYTISYRGRIYFEQNI